MQFVNNITADAVVLLRHDAHPLAVVERGSEIVHHQAVNPCADKSDDHHTEIVDEESRAADNSTSNAHRRANVEMQILVYNLGQNVQSARRGVDAEHQCLRRTQQQYKAAEVQPRVAHYRHRAGSQILIGNLLPRQDSIPHIGERTQYHGGVDRLSTELMPNQHPCQYQQYGVDSHNDDRQTDVDARCCKDIAQHNRQT